LRLARDRYTFIKFQDHAAPGKNILWRHDVDMSVHRAVKLARMESGLGLRATYFILLHCEHYNTLEKEVAGRIAEIAALGHELGLHFDPSFYGFTLESPGGFRERLAWEKALLEKIFQTKIDAFSFHNPEIGGWAGFDEPEVEGMVNAYGAGLRKNFAFCSDSNGYWRFQRLRDVLERADDEKLHVLTHPLWWVPEVLSPRERVTRCIDGRRDFQHRFYDQIIAANGRENVGLRPDQA